MRWPLLLQDFQAMLTSFAKRYRVDNPNFSMIHNFLKQFLSGIIEDNKTNNHFLDKL